MKITVITPSFNQAAFIEQTIRSVLSQNYPDLEYLIYDGGSTDGTIEILKKYDAQIRWVSEKDKGQSDAINKGMKAATGDIICFINSDDYLLPCTLQAVTDYFEFYPQAMWLTGNTLIVDESGKEIQSFIGKYKKLLRHFPRFGLLSIVNFIDQPSTFWRRQIIDEFGYFDESLHLTMDYDYWLKIIKKHPLYVLKRHLAAFRIHKLSKGGHDYKRQFKEAHEVMRKYTANPILRGLNSIHNFLIIALYKLLK